MRHPLHPLSWAVALVLSSNTFASTLDTNVPPINIADAPDARKDTANSDLKVIVKADRSRDDASVLTGGSRYKITAKDIANMPQGDSTPLNQVLLQAPGVVQDSYGQVHIRGDHGDLQYRINGTILPESISGFGQTLDPSFMGSVNLLTGALPAQYGDRTAGIIDIQTKKGDSTDTGSIGITLGSNHSREVTGSVSGRKNDLTYYLNGSLLGNNLGIENPTSSNDTIHNRTNQFKGFGYFSYRLDDASNVNLILGSTNSRFQIPNSLDQQANYALAGFTNYPSTDLNERQNEVTHYGVLSFQSAIGDLFNYQLSASSRYTSVHYYPDNIGSLIYTGVASTIARSGWENGVQADATYRLSDQHTIRFGGVTSVEKLKNRSDVLSFPADPNGNQTTNQPISYQDGNQKNAYLAGFYVQDAWKATDKLTINYGGRFDYVDSYATESQFSPRINAVFELRPETNLHLGYARYFTPSPTELVTTDTINASQGTTSAPPGTLNDAVRAESYDYYDMGIHHKFTQQFTVGVNSYYKKVKNLLDEGQFGSAVIFTPFNYAQGKAYGVELNVDYQDGNFNAYANLTRSAALGKNINSSQYAFDSDELDYVATRWIHLDHEQTLSASAGMSYRLRDTTYSANALYGSGLRKDFANTEHLPDYITMSVGAARTINTSYLGQLEGRLSISNVTDEVYQIRDGSGVGVGAPQFGARRSFYVGVTKMF